ncbi:PilZ domain-containing protein [Sphingosinicella sp. LHD-64]|uniref:PilZ domain-containing protein n=1 Tax=Sphingosinicella sp. LHD-64 TaxID=3072139 RepID=UPI00280E78F7|nr:PilZ domain-containing protein [Sphingosinicella sp. LHD-64]MDQ8757820.1 PilZ domain-containing protein [Sphingosinicella sp. LHD-64]
MPLDPSAHAGARSRRRERRYAMRLPAAIRDGNVFLPAVLCDLSQGGALAQSRTPPPQGRAVTFRAGDLECAARVVWVRGQRFGLIFQTPISATALLVAMSRTRAVLDGPSAMLAEREVRR